jgi:hypothetical protein
MKDDLCQRKVLRLLKNLKGEIVRNMFLQMG